MSEALPRAAFMLKLMATLETPNACRCPCGGYLLCLGAEHVGWKLACMRCGAVAFEEIPPRHDTILPPPSDDDGELE